MKGSNIIKEVEISTIRSSKKWYANKGDEKII